MGQTSSLTVGRLFTQRKSKGYDQLTWLKQDSLITNPGTGKPVFEQKDVEFPEGWSLNAINIVAQKYFCGTPGTLEREASLKQLVERVVDTVVDSVVDSRLHDASLSAGAGGPSVPSLRSQRPDNAFRSGREI